MNIVNKPKIDLLSLLKAVAAVFIVFHHYQQVLDCSFDGVNFYNGLFYFGYLVELFFMVSGFVTLYSAKAGGSHPIRQILHKVFRIIPVVTIALLFTLGVKTIFSLFFEPENISQLWSIKTLIANFFLIFRGYPFFSMVGINNPTWYLCILIQCYLLWYITLFISEKIRLPRIYMTCFVLVAGIILYRFIPIESVRGVECFYIGTLLCEILEFEKINLILNEKKIKLTMIISSLIIMASSIVLITMVPTIYQRLILLTGVFPELIIICYCLREK